MNHPLRLLLLALLSLLVLRCGTLRSERLKLRSLEVRSRTEWKAAAPKPYRTHVPVRLTVHHEGTRLAAGTDPARKILAIQRWGMGPDRNWADVPYHYFIAPDGTIYQGRDVNTVGETNTEYDPAGHLLIVCLGNLNEDPVPPEQLAALIRLVAWCSRTYRIPLSTLATHRDHSKQTTCPGKNLYAYFQNGHVQKAAAKLLR